MSDTWESMKIRIFRVILRMNLSYIQNIDRDPETISLKVKCAIIIIPTILSSAIIVFSLKETLSTINPSSTEFHGSAADMYALFDIAAMDQARCEPPRMSFALKT